MQCRLSLASRAWTRPVACSPRLVTTFSILLSSCCPRRPPRRLVYGCALSSGCSRRAMGSRCVGGREGEKGGGLPARLGEAMAAGYEPLSVEADWYEWWEESGRFKPPPPKGEGEEEDVFSMVLPPPNVTGVLHVGHALTCTIQDVLARWHRMRGHSVLWVPGLDHAGIATQVVVEKDLLKHEGVSRHALGRQAFVERVWAWKKSKGGVINTQLRRLGASLDWSREAFTMDEARSRAVEEAFVRLHGEGLIFRSTRLVNWCCYLNTAISDLEVEIKHINGPTWLQLPGGSGADGGGGGGRRVRVGVMYKFRYYVVAEVGEGEGGAGDGEGREYVEVATTRPETMFGDSAVAVHPTDPRYRHLVGRRVAIPLTHRSIPVVADAELVDMELGTGVVKVTPAHDANDYACGVRHKLPALQVITEEGCMVGGGGGQEVPEGEATPVLVPVELQGLDRFECRERVLSLLEAGGASVGRTDHAMQVAVCSRSGDVLEPLLKPQWFVDTSEMARHALASVEQGCVQFGPHGTAAQHRATWRQWLGSPQPWCVSRQLWWGHRIPAYRVVWGSGNLPLPNVATAAPESPRGGGGGGGNGRGTDGDWVVARNEEEARQEVIKRFGGGASETGVGDAAAGDDANRLMDSSGGVRLEELELEFTLERDPDVLDTWFSSALFPLAVLGWPGASSRSENQESDLNSEDLRRFYPLSLMETGADILFFWVARMSMLCHRLFKHTPPSPPLLPRAATPQDPEGAEGGAQAASAFAGRVPFTSVLLHPVVRDASGIKMSKSLGNVIDPVVLMEGGLLNATNVQTSKQAKLSDKGKGNSKGDAGQVVEACGADGLRLALCHYMQQGRSINLDPHRVVKARHFANKIWQAARFTLLRLDQAAEAGAGSQMVHGERLNVSSLSLPCQWILHRCASATEAANRALHAKELGQATTALQSFFLDDFCSVFIEFAKHATTPAPAPSTLTSSSPSSSSYLASQRSAVSGGQLTTLQVLATVLERSLRLLHPFMPFITEELWQRLATNPQHAAFLTHQLPPLSAPFCQRTSDTPPPSLMEATYPSIEDVSPWMDASGGRAVEDGMRLLLDTIHAVRSLKQRFGPHIARRPVAAEGETGDPGVYPSRLPAMVFHLVLDAGAAEEPAQRTLLEEHAQEIRQLCGTPHIAFLQHVPQNCATQALPSSRAVQVAAPLCITEALGEELARLRSKLAKLTKTKLAMDSKLSGKNYQQRVPEKVRTADQVKLETLKKHIDDVLGTIDTLSQASGPSTCT